MQKIYMYIRFFVRVWILAWSAEIFGQASQAALPIITQDKTSQKKRLPIPEQTFTLPDLKIEGEVISPSLSWFEQESYDLSLSHDEAINFIDKLSKNPDQQPIENE